MLSQPIIALLCAALVCVPFLLITRNLNGRIAEEHKTAHITIKDDGMGLANEETSHIFELNYQGSNKIEGRGYGHGLYLAQRAAQAHGGSITAASAPGMGMAIKISLPLS